MPGPLISSTTYNLECRVFGTPFTSIDAAFDDGGDISTTAPVNTGFWQVTFNWLSGGVGTIYIGSTPHGVGSSNVVHSGFVTDTLNPAPVSHAPGTVSWLWSRIDWTGIPMPAEGEFVSNVEAVVDYYEPEPACIEVEGTVENATVEPTSATSLLVSWDPPLVGSEPITYEIYDWDTFDLLWSGTDTEHEFTGLTESQQYCFAIYPFNDCGGGDFADDPVCGTPEFVEEEPEPEPEPEPEEEEECPPGVLSQEPPLYPGSYRNDAGLPLIGVPGGVRSLFPRWMANDACSLLNRVIGSLFVENDSLNRSITSIKELRSLSPQLNEPRLIYQTQLPVEINLDNASRVSLSYLEPRSGNWLHIPQVQTQIEFTQSAGPCYYLSDNGIIQLINLERVTERVTGSVSGNLYAYSLDGLVTDKNVFYTTGATGSTGYKLPQRRWVKVTPEERDIRTLLLHSESALYLARSFEPSATGFYIRWETENKSYLQVASISNYKNTWDILGEYNNLPRVRFENNTDYKDRLSLVRRLKSEGRECVLGGSSNKLSALKLIRWDGVSSIDIAATYSLFTRVILTGRKEIEQAEEVLEPVSENLYSSRTKNWLSGAEIYINGLKVQDSWTASGGLVSFSIPTNNKTITARYSYKTFEISSGSIISTGNLPKDNYILGVVTGIDIFSLSELLETDLLSEGIPTLYFRQIINYLTEKHPFGYNKTRWGTPQGRFFNEETTAPLPSKLSLPFED